MAANDKAWLRKFYPPGSDEPHFDLTPATEKPWVVFGAGYGFDALAKAAWLRQRALHY